MPRKKTIEEFLILFTQKHGYKYDYSLIKEYLKNNTSKMPIICTIHKEVFYQNNKKIDHTDFVNLVLYGFNKINLKTLKCSK